MTKITFVEPGGTVRTVEGTDGFSVMEIAVRNGIEGIVAECGGACACATCHVHIAQEWHAAVGEAGPDEADMLEFAAHRLEASRLSCQIRVTPALDGLVVQVPDSQR